MKRGSSSRLPTCRGGADQVVPRWTVAMFCLCSITSVMRRVARAIHETCLAIERLPYLRAKASRCEGLTEQVNARLDTMLDDRAVGIARHEENLQCGPPGQQTGGERLPVHLRHDDVREQ